jgi:hypothetical protein
MEKGVLLLRVALVEGLDHTVLSLDVTLDLLQVVRHPSEVLLLLPVHRLLRPLRTREDVLNCVAGHEVFTGTQTLHWLLCDPWDGDFLVTAVIGEIADWMREGVPGGRVSFPMVPVCFLRKD